MISLVGPGDGRMVRIDELLFRFSLDAATDYLLGDSVGSLEDQTSDFAAAFNEVQRVQALKTRAGSVVDFTHWRGRQLMERQCCEMANSIQVLQ